MKHLTTLFLLATVLSCSQKVDDIQQLNGYWEIEKVLMENGESKEYTVNETIDHFVVNEDLSGSRNKVRPLLDGSFITVTKDEKINLKEENKKWIISYQTDFFSWTETIQKLDGDHLELINESHNTYIYKRYQSEKELEK